MRALWTRTVARRQRGRRSPPQEWPRRAEALSLRASRQKERLGASRLTRILCNAHESLPRRRGRRRLV